MIKQMLIFALIVIYTTLATQVSERQGIDAYYTLSGLPSRKDYVIVASWNSEAYVTIGGVCLKTKTYFTEQLCNGIQKRIQIKNFQNQNCIITFNVEEQIILGFTFKSQLKLDGRIARIFSFSYPIYYDPSSQFKNNIQDQFQTKKLQKCKALGLEMFSKSSKTTLTRYKYMSCQSFNIATCGNMVVEEEQQCDNGRKLGCLRCKIEPGYSCKGSVCQLCGDGIKTISQQCDNGRKPGCSNCVIELGWKCFGNTQGTSICVRMPKCGNKILEAGQQCDNGNQMGCKNMCKIDSGYKCTDILGQISQCSQCGNYVVEYGQECDNGKQDGCWNCLKQPGWECRGLSNSQCFRKNPVCGNGIVEIGQQCDDGNRTDGDGCGVNCIPQTGYRCIKEMWQKSLCSPSMY